MTHDAGDRGDMWWNTRYTCFFVLARFIDRVNLLFQRARAADLGALLVLILAR